MAGVRKFSIFLYFILLTTGTMFGAQKIRCSTMDVFNKRAMVDPNTIQRKEKLDNDIQQWLSNHVNKQTAPVVITIPVVVHVIWNTAQQNISDAQILSQIDRLNKDYRKLNTDMVSSLHPFYSLAGDAGIEFCLAKIDPAGHTTTGVTRTNTSVTGFITDDNVKFTSSGGLDAWDATNYLNIWVCNLSGDLLGYAQFPSDMGSYPETDGVVIGYSNFGTTGVVLAPYDLGRTATHEIGHWLNLEHVWGDDEGLLLNCLGSDNVNDTPNQGEPTYSCPSGVQTDNCATTSPGYMYENYLDYTDDACMVMFTNGQISRMRTALTVARASILLSNKCSGATLVNQQIVKNLRIYPNPVQNYLTIEGLPKTRSGSFTADIFNILGEKVYSATLTSSINLVEMQGLKTGTYVISIYNEEFSATEKLTVVK